MRYDECEVCGAERSTKVSLCERCARVVDDGASYFTIGDFCDDCPCFSWPATGPACGCEDGSAHSAWPQSERYAVRDGWDWRRPRPDWCPLRKGGVLVVEATKAEREAEGT